MSKSLLFLFGCATLLLLLPASTAASTAASGSAGSNREPADSSASVMSVDDTIEVDPQVVRVNPRFRRTTKLGAWVAYDHLTDSMEAWNEAAIDFSTRLRPGRSLYGYVSQQERFGHQDFEGLLGYYHSLGNRWLLNLEAKASPTHNVLPIWMVFAQIEHSFGSGWRAGLGGRHAVYDAIGGSKPVNVANFMVEKYFSDFRAAYTMFTSNLRDTVGIRLSHLMQLGYYYGGFDDEVSAINVGASFGVESAEFVDPNMFGLDLRSFFIRGSHWLVPRWALTYGLRTNKQQHYSRYGIQLGVDHRL